VYVPVARHGPESIIDGVVKALGVLEQKAMGTQTRTISGKRLKITMAETLNKIDKSELLAKVKELQAKGNRLYRSRVRSPMNLKSPIVSIKTWP